RYISMRVVVDSDLIALEQQSILFPRKIIAPQTFFTAHHEIGIVPALCPRERRRRVESNAFSSKSQDRKSTRLNSSHQIISYAVHRDLPAFPTRRSSDLALHFHACGGRF